MVVNDKNAHKRLLSVVRAYEVTALQHGGVKAARRRDVDALLLMMDAIDDEHTLLYEVKLYAENMKTGWYGYFFGKCVFRMSLMRVVMSEIGRLEKQREMHDQYSSFFLQSSMNKPLAMQLDCKDYRAYQPIILSDGASEEAVGECWRSSGRDDQDRRLRL